MKSNNKDIKMKIDTKTKLLTFADFVITALIFGGLLAVFMNTDNPQIIQLAASSILLGLILSKSLRFYENIERSKLNQAQETDLSFLRQIRMLVKDGHSVTDEHLNVSLRASNDSDSEYFRINGFARPKAAVGVKSTVLK